MAQEGSREYASQADYVQWVNDATTARRSEILSALREAFAGVTSLGEVEIVSFSELTALDIAERLSRFPTVLKPILLAASIAAWAIERDLGIRNLNTYVPRLSSEQALSIASYLKPFLPDSLPLPTLVELDAVMFADKEIRKTKGQWERAVCASLNSCAGVAFKKSRFSHNGQSFEVDAAARDNAGRIAYAVDIKRIEARRDIHKRSDEIVNKAAHFKAAFPQGKFGAIIYYPFVSEHGNVRDRLQSPHIDSVVFAGAATESIESAVGLLLGKFGCTRS